MLFVFISYLFGGGVNRWEEREGSKEEVEEKCFEGAQKHKHGQCMS